IKSLKINNKNDRNLQKIILKQDPIRNLETLRRKRPRLRLTIISLPSTKQKRPTRSSHESHSDGFWKKKRTSQSKSLQKPQTHLQTIFILYPPSNNRGSPLKYLRKRLLALRTETGPRNLLPTKEMPKNPENFKIDGTDL
ncbi:MAG: hypothetical protein AAB968_04215, partial [Patescibacteria group bacterium]